MVVVLTSLRSRPISLAVADADELSKLLTLLEESAEVKHYKLIYGEVRVTNLKSSFGWADEEHPKFLGIGNFFQTRVSKPAFLPEHQLGSVVEDYASRFE